MSGAGRNAEAIAKNQERARRIAARHDAGESIADLVRDTGHSETHIYRIIKRFGNLHPSNYWISDAERRAIVDAYQGGETIKQIEARLGRNRNKVGKIIKASGIAYRLRCGLNKSRAHQKYTVDESYFETIDSERKAWLLGFIASDGNVCISKQRRHTLGIGLAWKDVEILETIKAELKFSGSVRRVRMTYRGADYFMAMLSLSSVKIVHDLIALGVMPNKSLVLQPWPGPTELMPHYWRGVFDGDGCFSRSQVGRWQASLAGNKTMCLGFKDYCALLGVHASAYAKKDSQNGWAAGSSSRQGVLKFATHLYASASISLPRKWELAKRIMAGLPPVLQAS